MEKSGYLEIIIGCMYAGKTSRLISIYKRNQICNIPTIVINHIEDNRYDNVKMSTHDKIMIPCIQTAKLYDILKDNEEILNNNVFIINEGQFFPDLFDFVNMLISKHNKKVYIGGLDGDFKMNKFGQILDLIPLCNKIEKLNAICTICKNEASFTKRLTKDTNQKIIGTDIYIPVCRSCHSK
jgi:thymidine kinase